MIKRVSLFIVIIIVAATAGWFFYLKFNRTTETHIDLETGRKVVAQYDNDGQLDGQSLAYQDSKLVASAEFKHGLKNGISIKYFPNGQKEIVGNFVKDLQDGLRTVYHHNGTVKSVENWKDGRLYGNTYFYHQNGKLRCYNVRDINETVFYTYEVNEGGTVMMNHGKVFSNNIYSRLADSAIILKDRHRYKGIKDLYITFSSPPDIPFEIEALINQQKATLVKTDSSTYRITEAFTPGKKYLVKIVGKFNDKNDKLIQADSLITSIVVE